MILLQHNPISALHIHTNITQNRPVNHREYPAQYCFKIDGKYRKTSAANLPVVTMASKPNKGYSISKPQQENSESGSGNLDEKRGTILGAASLIVGTSIGSGILALPERTSLAGIIPSATAITLCWLFLVIEALILAEINVHMRNNLKKDKKATSSELEAVSLPTMAEHTLGEWGGNLATVTYLLLAYSSMVAYTSKSGDVLSQFINLPSSISGTLFTVILSLLMLVGGTHVIDRVNQWLTITMIGLLVGIELTTFSYGVINESPLDRISNWENVPSTIPVIIFSLVYHDITPVICAYLGGDLKRIRVSIVLGSIVPFLLLLFWNGIALDLSQNFDGMDPLDFLVRGRWKNMHPVIQAFSLLAVGTSIIGTLLGFSQFYLEQLTILFPTLITKMEKPKRGTLGIPVSNDSGGKKWFNGNRQLAYVATSIAVVPSILISAFVADAFSLATDVAGGYCMIILYGVLPPAIAWTSQSKSFENKKRNNLVGIQTNASILALSNVKPVLVGVGLISCGIIMDQLFQDLFLK